MRIQHNIMAMNAYRNYNTNNSALSKNLEKLSSGYKINRAGDDAAGLAISEKMRAQITGLETAQKNAKDGVSLVQTAEGALTEVHDMLNRMVELATQSSNGTYADDVDRENLQEEIEQLKSEINRIADSANFNGIKLLDGTMDAGGTGGGASVDISFDKLTAAVEGVTTTVKPKFTVDLAGMSVQLGAGATQQTVNVSVGGVNITISASSTTAGALVTTGGLRLSTTSAVIGGVTYGISINNGKLEFTTTASDADLAKDGVILKPDYEVSVEGQGVKGSINGGTVVVDEGKVAKPAEIGHADFTLSKDMLKNGASITIGNQTFSIDYEKTADEASGTTIGVKDLLNDSGELDASKVSEVAGRISKAAGTGNTYFDIGVSGNKLTISTKATLTGDNLKAVDTVDEIKKMIAVNNPTNSGNALNLQIGDSSDTFNQLKVSIQDMHIKTLGIDAIDIGDQEGAQAAVDIIKSAINTVSSVRGTLGATQNRLDHTMNNLSVMTENIQDAESTIRDTDVADEMMAYTKNNILIQSAQAMLAQANQVPQGVLQLLG